ncbi:LysR family transcriptional regulator [Nocardiopsis mangrovi]|uniref:LysR family transcriptional regulator n=1 Tax=Nocardiopsis mangrovi TaxID=1179818 RepID=A0ABV9DRM2_9ACTN
MLMRQLEYLTALAREQHFARAAMACHVTQPALSAGIRKLEAELDVPIVRRAHRFEGFTPEGERVLRWAYRLLAERDALTGEVGPMREGHTGTLRIGALPEAAAPLAHITAGFGVRHPRVRLVVRSMPAADIRAALDRFDLDVGVTRLSAASARDRNRAVRLFRTRHALVAGEDGRFSGVAAVRWAELAHVPMARFTADPEGQRLLDEAMAASGTPWAAQIETDSLPALYTHVREGGWCAVLPHAWLCGAEPPPGLRVLPMVEPVSDIEVGMVAAERRPEPLLARELLAHARGVPVQGIVDRVLPAPAAGAPAALPRASGAG